MVRVLSDSEIAALVQERKPLPADWRNRIRMRPKGAHEEFDVHVTGDAGHAFRLVARRSSGNPLDFSVILLFVEDGDDPYTLRRNNGAHSSDHTNKWEKENDLPNWVIRRGSLHRHVATERYQAGGLRIDGYAEPAGDYHDFASAVDDMLRQCGFAEPDGAVPQLGDGGGL